MFRVDQLFSRAVPVAAAASLRLREHPEGPMRKRAVLQSNPPGETAKEILSETPVSE